MAATSTGQIERLMDELADLIEVDALTVYRRTVLSLYTKVIIRTPVDTGRARASWRIGVGEIDFSTAPEGFGSAPPTAPIDAISFAFPTFVTNSVSYIEKLEHGHSRQAPSGMLRISVAEVQAELAEAVG